MNDKNAISDKKILNSEERQAYILEQLKIHGKVRVVDLSRDLDVSGVTIRSDLENLQKTEYLERVHGGAIQSLHQYDNMDYQERLLLRRQEKMEIAREILNYINNGDTIALNAGTTSYFVALELKNKKNLKIITNSIPVATELNMNSNIKIILLGGAINSHYSFTYGMDALNQMEKYRINKAIISVDGVDINAGITTFHQEEVDLSAKMMERAKVRIVISDYTKIGRESFVKIKDLDEVDRIITDSKADRNIVEMLKKKGAEVVCAPHF
ncbi:MAG TPA: DeoR/GlpR transcriptional regulator [Clostridiaceae bacterium]|nr:DeoR/GlpR transcriptional regulator [Clostridiaceae bacterium]